MYFRIEQINKYIVNNRGKRKWVGSLKWAVWKRVWYGAKCIGQQSPMTCLGIHQRLLWNL